MCQRPREQCFQVPKRKPASISTGSAATTPGTGIQVAHGILVGAGSLYPLELMAEQVIPAAGKF
jgi:hypothetical protein